MVRSSKLARAACVVLVAWWLPGGCAVSLWSRLATRAESGIAEEPDIPTNKEITAKWDKMDEFLKIMFTLACKWKHGKDVNGLAAHNLRSGKLSGDEARSFKAGIQADNLKQVKQACGMIDARGKKTCRQGCADRWGEALGRRGKCDEACVKAYAKFESSCMLKADNLQKVYAMKLDMADSRQRCYHGHCDHFPTVWMKASESDMTGEVDTQCKAQCTAEQVKARCQRKWQLEVDFVRTSIRSKCAEDSGVKTCFDKKKGEVSKTYDKCASDGKGTCGKQFDECKTKGKTDATFEQAGEFCDKRNKMCLKQVDADCLKTNKADLEQAQSDCEKEASTDFDKCESDALDKKEKEETSKCEGELGPKCKEDCAKKCDVTGMKKCLKNLEGQADPAEAFCEDFWRLLHDSSEVDPVTGNPIVLLEPSAL